MRFASALCVFALVGCNSGSSPTTDGGADAGAQPLPPWIVSERILVPGVGVMNEDCRKTICRHNENTDLALWKGAIMFVHRTAKSQVLGPNSALHIYQSTDEGAHFTELAVIAAPLSDNLADDNGRDLRDPHFYHV